MFKKKGYTCATGTGEAFPKIEANGKAEPYRKGCGEAAEHTIDTRQSSRTIVKSHHLTLALCGAYKHHDKRGELRRLAAT
jgi:hypothetical protein